MPDTRVSQVTASIALIVEGHKSMADMLMVEREFLDEKWPRPHTASETSVLAQIDRVLAYLEKSMQQLTALAERIRELDRPEIRSIKGEAIR